MATLGGYPKDGNASRGVSGTRRVLLVNPNTNARTTETMASIVQAVLDEAGSAVRVEGATAPFGHAMIVDVAALAVGAQAVEAIGKGIAPERYAMAIISAFGDPGQDAFARVTGLPTIGIGEASFHEAARDGMPFAVATTTPGLIGAIRARAHALDLADRFLGTFVSAADPLALMSNCELLKAALSNAVADAANAGARRIIIGGGPLGQIAQRLDPPADTGLVLPLYSAARVVLQRLRQLSAGT